MNRMEAERTVGAGVADDELEWALRVLSLRGVAVVRWSGGRRPTVDPAQPALYLLAPGVEAPSCGELHDWVRTPVGAQEVRDRGARLLARLRPDPVVLPTVDEDGVLRAGDVVIVLGAQEAAIVRVLLASPGRVVSRADVAAAVWPDGAPTDPRALDDRVKVVRRHLAGLPLRIHTLRGRGLLLEVGVAR